MDFFKTISMNIFSILYLLIVCFSLILRKQQYSTLNRFFISIAAAVIVLLIFEIASWYFEGKPGPAARRLNYIFNFIFFIVNPIPAVAWLCYLDYKIHGSLERLRKRLYYLPVLFVTTTLMLINLKVNRIFGIDENNIYYRGPGGIVYTVIIFLIIYSSIPMVIKNRKYIDRNIFIAFYAFSVFPLLGAIFQLLLPGTLIVWNAVALAVLTVFIFLEIQYLSKDFLTGLYSRRQIDEWIAHRIRTTNKGKHSFSLILLDLDKFKSINDNYGHSEGDQALIIFSNILGQCVKTGDITSRYAGDEFLIALETDDPAAAGSVIERIREKTAEFNEKKIKPYTISFSAGQVVFNPELHTTNTLLFQQVDKEMYLNKERDRI